MKKDAEGGAPKGKMRRKAMTWVNIVGGDILATDFLRRQSKLLALIVLMAIFYIHNRYACQQQMLEIDRLKKELTDIKYDALTKRAEWTEHSRQSHIEESIALKRSKLHAPTQPPYILK